MLIITYVAVIEKSNSILVLLVTFNNYTAMFVLEVKVNLSIKDLETTTLNRYEHLRKTRNSSSCLKIRLLC